MASITDLLRDTVRVINELTETSEEAIQQKLLSIITRNDNVKVATIERYMTFMNEQIFSKLSNEHPLEDLRQLVPLIEKLVVLISDDGLSLEEALNAAHAAQQVATVVVSEMKRPFSFACLLGAGKRILPAARRLFAVCNGKAAVAVVDPAALVPAVPEVPAVPAIDQVPTEQLPPADDPVPGPSQPELREAEPSPSASDNADQKEESAN
jgi:hypothetical protein